MSGSDKEKSMPEIVDDLATLVRRLVRELKKVAPDNKLPGAALDYLSRVGLQTSPFREDDEAK